MCLKDVYQNGLHLLSDFDDDTLELLLEFVDFKFFGNTSNGRHSARQNRRGSASSTGMQIFEISMLMWS